MRHAGLAVLAILCSTVAAFEQLSKFDEVAIAAYQSAIRAAESDGRHEAIEAAFAKIAPLRGALTRPRNGRSALESLSNQEFQQLARSLTGLHIFREEVVGVEPDVNYFLKLATDRGEGADRMFFAALKATHPEPFSPVYVERQTDYSGCTRFGTLSLVETYRRWSEFQRRAPAHYVAAAAKERGAVARELTQSTCACGDSASVEQELQQFVTDFPASSITSRVEERLRDVRAGRSKIRIKCVSG